MSSCHQGAGNRTAAATTVEGDNGVSRGGVNCTASPRKRLAQRRGKAHDGSPDSAVFVFMEEQQKRIPR